MAKTRQSSHRPTHKMRTRSQGAAPAPSQPRRSSKPRTPRAKAPKSPRAQQGRRSGPPKGYAYVGDKPITVAARYALSRASFNSLMRTYWSASEEDRNGLDWKWVNGTFVRLGEEEECPDDSIEVVVKVPENLEFLEWPKALGFENSVLGETEAMAEDVEDGDSDSGLSEHSDSEFVGVDL